MMSDHIALLLMDYLEGNLSPESREELEHQLAKDADLRKTLEELRTILDRVDQLPEQQPSSALERGFIHFLTAEKTRMQSPNWRGRIFSFHALPKVELQAAAAVALLLIGLGFGWFWRVNQRQQTELMALRQEVSKTQKMLILSMLEQPSASERIQAVNVLEQQSNADPKVIQALVYTLNFDDMINVRMKAAQALGSFADDKGARDALISSLSTQESPEVKIIIIEILVALRDKKVVPALRSLSTDEAQLDFVREQAKIGLQRLL